MDASLEIVALKLLWHLSDYHLCRIMSSSLDRSHGQASYLFNLRHARLPILLLRAPLAVLVVALELWKCYSGAGEEVRRYGLRRSVVSISLHKG